MASSSYTLSLPLQLLRSASPSARLGQGTPGYRPSLSAGGRLQTTTTTTTTKGLRSVAATSSYQHEAAGHGDSGIVVATGALNLVAAGDDGDEVLRGAVRVRGGAHRSPKGRPGTPREGSGGAGGKVNAALPTLLRLPKEGAGGQGGSIN